MEELRALIKRNPKVSIVLLLALLVFGMTQNPPVPIPCYGHHPA
jgi:hypothetical protein